jgi:hypothetical protein
VIGMLHGNMLPLRIKLKLACGGCRSCTRHLVRGD